MSLSSSTLSLKFMQRGQARSQPSTPTPTSTSTSQTNNVPTSTPSSSSKPSEAYLSATASAAARGDKMIIQNEEEWFIPSSSSRSRSGRSAVQRGGPVFESSYVPFLVGHPSDAGPSGSNPQEGPSGGGGRMTFGGFGLDQSDKKAEVKREDGDGDEDMSDAVEVEEEVRTVKKERTKPIKTEPSHTPQPRTLLKPAVSPPPPSSHSQNKSQPLKSQNTPSVNERPISIAEKMRQTISSSRNSPSTSNASSPAPSTSSSSIKKDKLKNKNKRPTSERESLASPLVSKKIKIEPDSQRSQAQAQAQAQQKMSLDEREKALKAQKKRDKKKAKAQEQS
ncbi:hypothetical protein I302_101358 [Kwoniella bestiolae CBS 10118]|uniref:Uncharacterized protein n=1 Tax=Kwoniella bestiolae CBS 10118 TaxID=1296100 RepID=A0A1B9GC11_9TREE|nr:hypothetical protein I302_00041 [Kwoniella bestiolae CBS 10118]OCF28553.1 hypothetical protein I302_00041 [Kwoniella bestiolae CBS 10118]